MKRLRSSKYLAIVGLTLATGVLATNQPAAAQVPRCFGKTATIIGTDGNDRIVGTPKDDVIVTLGGNDVVDGGGGNDRICSGRGKDTVSGGGGNDFINLGGGRDVADGGPGRDRIRGGGGADNIVGGDGDDSLKGGGGSDFLDGQGGFDKANGGGGIDVCRAESLTRCDPHRLESEIKRANWRSCSDLRWTTGPAEISGHVYANSVFCENDTSGNSGWLEYDLGRKYRLFRSIVGQDDNSPNADVTYRFRIFGDDELLSTVDVLFGEAKTISANVRGVLRLRLEVELIRDDGTFLDAVAVWAEPMVTGGANAPIEEPGRIEPLTRARVGTDLRSVRHKSCADLRWTVNPVSINGETYSDSLYCENDSVGDDGWIEYNLSRAYSRLTTTVGQGDSSPNTQIVYRFRIFVDDELIQSVDVGFGDARALDLDLRNRLRLRLEVEVISAPRGFDDAVAVFGEPVLR